MRLFSATLGLLFVLSIVLGMSMGIYTLSPYGIVRVLRDV